MYDAIVSCESPVAAGSGADITVAPTNCSDLNRHVLKVPTMKNAFEELH